MFLINTLCYIFTYCTTLIEIFQDQKSYYINTITLSQSLFPIKMINIIHLQRIRMYTHTYIHTQISRTYSSLIVQNISLGHTDHHVRSIYDKGNIVQYILIHTRIRTIHTLVPQFYTEKKGTSAPYICF